MYVPSIEISAFFKEFFFQKKNSFQITFYLQLSEMYLSHEKSQALSFDYAQRQPSFSLIYQVNEDKDGI